MRKNSIFIVLGLLLSSCVVLHEEYFYPQASGATVEKQWCRGQVGVDNQLVFHFSNVDVEFEVWEYKGITRLGIGFKIKDGGTIVWPSQTVIALAGSKRKNIEVKGFTRLRRVSGTDKLLEKEFPTNSVMKNSDFEEVESYYESFIISEENIRKIEIEEILLLINGEENVLSDLTFTRKSGLFLHPLNC